MIVSSTSWERHVHLCCRHASAQWTRRCRIIPGAALQGATERPFAALPEGGKLFADAELQGFDIQNAAMH
jgi:hypothetical protein